MKAAVLAIDATRDTMPVIENVSRGLIRMQRAGLLEHIHVASVIHPDSYMLPYSFYREEKYKLAAQTKDELMGKFDSDLKLSSVEMLVTDDSSMDEHIELLNRFAGSVGADVLIAGTNAKSTLSYLVQGSFAEAASLHSPLPVLVYGGGAGDARNRRPPTILVALSPASLPSARTRKQIAELAVQLKAGISLLPVDDQSQWLSFKRQLVNETAETMRREFAQQGLLSVNVLTREPVLPGHVPSVADQQQALLTVFCSTEETLKKPWIAPSLNGRVISEMARPILILKEGLMKWTEPRRTPSPQVIRRAGLSPEL